MLGGTVIKKLTVTVLLIAILMLIGCKSKDDRKMPDQNQQSTPFVYAPLPPFNEIFKILDYLKMSDYDRAIDEKVFIVKQEVGHSAFALGVLTADGIISVRGHNKTKLNSIAEEMIRISNFLGLDESVLRLADQLKELINSDQWDELEKALEYYKNEVEGTLYQSQQYDQFTMMQVGGWTEGINRLAWFVDNQYNAKKSTVLMQKGTLNHLINNMEYINTPSIREAQYFKKTIEKLNQIKQVIDNPINNGYTQEQVKQLLTFSQDIKTVYIK
jgi:uncharacterized lipoprotein NlpE involved in copper resistance